MLETQGLTLLLQAAILAVAVSSVEAAQWVTTPPLVPIVLVAALLAAFIGRTGKLEYAYHIAAIGLGVLLAYMSAVYLTAAEEWALKFDELHTRLAEWWLAVTGEDATNDTLPLSMILVLLAWLAAYVSSWSLFKYRNPWISLVSVGTGLLVTLTYLTESFFSIHARLLLPEPDPDCAHDRPEAALRNAGPGQDLPRRRFTGCPCSRACCLAP